jgi:hypothetical protein
MKINLTANQRDYVSITSSDQGGSSDGSYDELRYRD